MCREINSPHTLREYSKYLDELAEDTGDNAIPLTYHKWYERDYESRYDEESYD